MSKARDIASASPVPSTVSVTELGYLDGVTSALQTQLNAKQAVVSGVDNTEIGYLDGVTSSIQTQLNSKSTYTTPTIGSTSIGSGATVTTIAGLTLTDPKVNLAFDAQTGTTYTTVLDDNGQIVTMNNASANTLSIPTNASVAYPIGTQINVLQIGAGQTTIQAVTSGTTTILSTGATAAAPKIRARYGMATCVKAATDTWYVIGDIA